MLLRGRIDAVWRGDDGLEILDFKTDRIAARDAPARAESYACLLYTSDAADDLLCVTLGCRRIL